MKDTGRINILKNLAKIADELDVKGLRKEANAVTNVMFRVSQYQGTNFTEQALQSWGENSINFVKKGIEAIKDLAESIGHGAIAVGSLAIAPVAAAIDGISHLDALRMNAAIAPYIKENEQLKAQLQEAARRNDKPRVVIIINQIQSNLNKIYSSLIEARKAAGQYDSSLADIQNTINYAVKNKLTVRQMYDYAFRNRGGDQKAGNYANNLLVKYRTIHADPPTAPVKPAKLV
jgi:tetratricopeptide (TPR) repeat protein